MIRKTFSLLAAAFLLTGCTMIPKYTRPEPPVPAAWPSGPAYTGPSAEEAAAPPASDLQWQDFVAGEHLRTIVETALKNNRDLRTAALNVERVQALYKIQRAALLPTVDATASGIRERVPGDLTNSGNPTTGNVFSASLGVSSWELDFFGRIRSLTKKALDEYFATEQARRSAQILLISEVVNVYLALAADRDNLDLAQSTLESQLAAYHVILRRNEVGLTPDLDLRQIQTRVESARVDVARYTEQLAKDQNALDLLVGSPTPEELLPESLSAVVPFGDVSPGVSSEALLRRPDILEAEYQLKAADANIGAARAAFFPRISLTTDIGTASSDLTSLFQSGSLAWNYAPRIVMPVFDARLWSALKATKVEREIAVTQYEKTIQSAFREVADALARKGTLGDQMRAQQALVYATAEAYRLSNARYEKGTDIFLNVLDAQRSFYSAQQGLIAINLSKRINLVQLYAALGGGGGPDPIQGQ